MKPYFLRHGETDYNKEVRMMGQVVDTSLNDAGRQQAEEVVAKLPSI